MPDRINTPFTNEHFAAFCLSMLGQPYWYGTALHKCSESLRASKARQYPSHYGSSRTSRYRDDIAKKKVCADCMARQKDTPGRLEDKGVLAAIGTDKTFDKKTGSNGCPDKSSNSMFSWAKSQGMDWGAIDTLPDIVGLAVRFDGHVGYTVGGGYAVEWRGFSYGCVKTKINGRGWTHWYKLPFIDYNDGAASVPEKEIALGSRLLRKDMEGSDVKALQEALMKLGYELPDYGADGEFGTETKEALMDFQKHEGLEVDGEYGEKSHAALMDALSDEEAGSGTAEPEPEDPETPDEPKPLGTTVMITGGSVYVRVGNGTNYRAITTVKLHDLRSRRHRPQRLERHCHQRSGRLGVREILRHHLKIKDAFAFLRGRPYGSRLLSAKRGESKNSVMLISSPCTFHG